MTYKCEVCGREQEKTGSGKFYYAAGKKVCSRHCSQYRDHGEFLDNFCIEEPNPEWFNTDQAAAYLGKPRRQDIVSMLSRGTLNGFKYGKRWYCTQEDLDDFLFKKNNLISLEKVSIFSGVSLHTLQRMCSSEKIKYLKGKTKEGLGGYGFKISPLEAFKIKYCIKPYLKKKYSEIEDDEKTIRNSYVEIPGGYLGILQNRHGDKVGEFYISKEDFPKVRKYRWNYQAGYVHNYNKGQLHRFILEDKIDDRDIIDHKNRNGLDCRRENLRICTMKENSRNRSITTKNKSGFIGIHLSSDKKRWVASTRGASFGFKDKVEAIYARYLLEEYLQKDFSNQEEHLRKQQFTQDLPEEIKHEIEEKVRVKLISKGLISDDYKTI